METIIEMYCQKMLSIPQISDATGIARSTIRFRLLKAGVLRSRADGVRVAAKDGRMIGRKGQTYVMSDSHKKNLSESKKRKADLYAKGVSLKPNGYMEYTRGEHKSRSVHVVTMELHIGRRLYSNECVHHIDHNRANNDLSNLQLMTRSEHSSLHAKDNVTKRKRKDNGRFL